ncbi:ABC transporter permease subunit [Sneathia sanguinegens]|uniref:ABC transporter permease subunit n=1 Tax=Sneathia sanguinegens TaxID=40543 RepID=UPI002582F30E|nr:ABC transporter permease subunit [Sneathia sanguinegens]MDU4652022.1 ABC transporter permease subunit [Sneathia sanguinegens]MDU7496355.1 ABC transporter permease subunit [Sneathia sanguinegens]
MDKKVYDSIGNAHVRKNLYLLDVAEGKKVDKNNHPYIKELEAFKNKEKQFLEKLHRDLSIKKIGYKGSCDKKEIKLRVELSEATMKKEFYKNYVELSYDCELAYNINKLKAERLPGIIDLYVSTICEKAQFTKKLKELNKENDEKAKVEFKEKVNKLKEELEKNKAKLKHSKNEGLISDKAYSEEVNQLKQALKDKVEVLKLQIPSEDLKSRVRVAKYITSVEVDSKYKILQQDMSDIIRKTPVEVEKVNKLIPIISFIIPGLGQLINKQYLKAALLFIGTLFIYLAAIPYALGYGNYRGQGIYGLYTLAKGAKKLDKSMIFMIEGLVAIILILLAITIMTTAYIDCRDVIKAKLKGIRPKTTFETITSIQEDGFPYIVTISTAILLMFIVLLPIFTTILLSFAGMDPKHQSKFAWVGLKNYLLLIEGKGIAGGPFWLILGWTVIWTIFSSTCAIAVGFFLALLANNDRIKGKSIFRTVYLLPWAVPAFITIMFFSIMTSPNGQITRILEGIFGGNLAIKSSTNLTRIALILLQTWLGSSYIFLLSTGVLQGIPADLYEAAEIDGATGWQKLSKITLPLVLFQTAPLLIGQYTFNFNNFSIIYLFNGGGPFDPSNYGNIAGSTDLLISYIYKLTIEKQYQSIGAAITIFISLGLMVFAYIGFKNSKAFKEEK